MEMLILNEVVFFEQPSVESIINKIKKMISKEYLFSHLIADGTEVYEDPERYLTEHLYSIGKLEVVTKTINEFRHELLISSKEYIERAKPEIKSLEIDFYHSPTADSWDHFLDLLDGIQWLNNMVTTIKQSGNHPNNWLNYLEISQSLQGELKSLQEAMENKDNVLIADIIQYEIYRLLESLEKEIQETIEKEGNNNDFNG